MTPSPTPGQKLARKRRGRGYSFEHGLVERINASEGWHARRMGGSSTGMPDLLATHNGFVHPNNPFSKPSGTILSIEAKSGQDNYLYVPKDQVQRCYNMLDMFGLYDNREVVLAFKFISKTKVRAKGLDGKATKVDATRQLREFYYRVSPLRSGTFPLPVCDYRCTYDGKLSYRETEEGEWQEIPAESYSQRTYHMPFNN